MESVSHSSARARLDVLAAALLFSTGGAAVKACQLGAWQVASFRCLVAGAFFVLVLPAARRNWRPRTWLVGLAYASTLTAYVMANKATTSANAIFLQSASPLYLLLLAPLLLKEPIRRRDLGLMVVMALGLTLCFGGQQTASATAPDPTSGNLWGALAGLAWAFTVLGLRWLASDAEKPGEAARAVVAGNLLAGFGALPPALSSGTASPVAPADVLLILYLGLVQIGVAYLLLTRGMAGVPAFEASLLLLAEPVLNPLFSWWIHDEVPTPGAGLGGGLILLATTWRAWLARGDTAPSPALDNQPDAAGPPSPGSR